MTGVCHELAQKSPFRPLFCGEKPQIMSAVNKTGQHKAHGYWNLCKITGVCQQLSVPKAEIV